MITTQPAERSGPKPLIWPVAAILPYFLWLWKGSARAAVEHRLRMTQVWQELAKLERIQRQQGQQEAKLFGQLLISCWTRLGEYYAFRWRSDPTTTTDDGGKRKRKKAQKVRFERVFVSHDYIYYKILVRKKTLFSYKDMLPLKVRVQDLISEETLYELAMNCQRKVTAIEDNPRYGVWVRVHRLEGMDGLPIEVSYQEMLEHYPTDTGKGTIILGQGEHRKVHQADLATYPHILVAGATGSGKSNMINLIISSFVRFMTPDEMKLVLIDLKRLEFAFYETLPHLLYPVIFDPQEAVETLQEIMQEVLRRAEMMHEGMAKELSIWNKKYPAHAMPRLVVVIDELAELMLSSGGRVGAEVEHLINRITNLGRAVGVHLIVATQRPAVQILSNAIKINMPLIIAGRTQNAQQSNTIIGMGDAAYLPEIKGRMLYLAGSRLTPIQTPHVLDEDIVQAVRIARGQAAKVIRLVALNPVIESEGLLRFILKEFDGSLSVTRLSPVLTEMAIDKSTMLKPFLADLLMQTEIELDGRVYGVSGRGEKRRLVLLRVNFDLDLEPEAKPILLLPATTEPPEPEPPKLPPLERFILETFVIGEQYEISAKKVYQAYTEWCKANRLRVESKTILGMYLHERGFQRRKTRGSIIWIGLSLKSEYPLAETGEGISERVLVEE